MIPLDELRRRLAAHTPERLPPPPDPAHHTAVALVLAGPPDDLALCVIRRAERAGDRWSGQMALPGGRGSAEDAHPRATAERETLEEVGLALTDAHWIGALSDVPLRRRGLQVAGILSPYVYHVGETRPPLHPSHDEVAGAWWFALTWLWDPANWTEYTWQDPDAPRTFPAIRTDGGVIWGLTYRVLTLFGEAIGLPALPAYR